MSPDRLTVFTNVHVLVTTCCNRKCPNCAQQIPRKAPGRHATREEFEYAAKYLRGCPISLSGGEPTVHPEFRRIACEFRDLFDTPRFELTTNGYRVAEYADVLHNFDSIRITEYPSTYSTEAIALVRQRFPERLTVLPAVHLPVSVPGQGHPCTREQFPIYSEGRIWPCCVGTGFATAESIPLTENWRDEIVNVPLPCAECVFSVSGDEQ